MGSYRLTENAETDLIRIHQWGVRNHGETQADKYYRNLIDHFEKLSEQPLIYPAVDDIRQGYRRSVCGVDSIYYRIEDGAIVIMATIAANETT